MPTVHRFAGLRVAIYPNDHRPAHVQVIGSDAEAVFLLNCDGPGVILRENHEFPAHAINRIETELNAVRCDLCRAWKSIDG